MMTATPENLTTLARREAWRRAWALFHRLWGKARGDDVRAPETYVKAEWSALQTLLEDLDRESR